MHLSAQVNMGQALSPFLPQALNGALTALIIRAANHECPELTCAPTLSCGREACPPCHLCVEGTGLVGCLGWFFIEVLSGVCGALGYLWHSSRSSAQIALSRKYHE